MKVKNVILFFAILFLFNPGITSVLGQDSLKIVRGRVDTTLSKLHVIVGVAEPNSQIVINNLGVKQYSTGSFGTELILSEGDNIITVEAIKGGKRESINFTVFYKNGDFIKPERKSEPYYGKIVMTKDGAYLNYGAGEDRLGGAKINFLPEGIDMEVLDSVNNLYKVKLSAHRYAYIPKVYVEARPQGTNPPSSLTGSWSVYNAGQYDRVRIALETKLPFVTKMFTDPLMLAVDIFGAECNSNWITQYRNLGIIESVDFEQRESDIMRVLIKLNRNFAWGYKVSYEGNSLLIDVKHTPVASLKGMVIGVDAGHGGPTSSGAVSASGIKEKDMNLSMAYMLKDELEKRGAKVVLSRVDDSDVPMSKRREIFRDGNIDLLVSIHCNAGGNPLRTGGTSTYYRHIEYRPLASIILDRLLDNGVNNFGMVGNFNFSLNASVEYPSVLVETLFMSNLEDEEKIADPNFRKKMMVSVVKGLEDYLKMVKKDKR